MKSVLRTSAASLLLCFAFAACSDISEPPWEEIEDVIGVYQLESVDGAPLPGLVFQDSASTVHVLEGAMEFQRDFSFGQIYRLVEEQGEEETDGDVLFRGSFSREGAELLLDHHDGSREVANVHGDLIILTTLEDLTFVFRKVE